MVAFANSKTACINCHQVGKIGGTVGPNLTKLVVERKPHEIVESLLWPKRKSMLNTSACYHHDGDTLSGYVLDRNANEFCSATCQRLEHKMEILLDDLEAEREVGTLMPENLVGQCPMVRCTIWLVFC